MHGADATSHCPLPLRFDVARLCADLGAVDEALWQPHYQTRDHDGGWTVVSLRSISGMQEMAYSVPNAVERYANTPLLERCPYFCEVLDRFECPKTAARLMRLAPDAEIREHVDQDLRCEDGEVRLHIPVTTHPDVVFRLAGEPVEMAPGSCWYLDLTLPHAVANRSPVDRVHLVVDCMVNGWIDEQLRAGGWSPGPSREVAAAGPSVPTSP